MGKDVYEHFMTCCGYRDFEHQDAHDFFYDYGFEDISTSWTAVHVPWNDLVRQLMERIEKVSRIKTSKHVISVRKEIDSLFQVATEDGSMYRCRRVILATRIQALQQLLPTKRIYRHIHGQPFLRVYAQLDTKSALILEKWVPTTTIVPGPLQKIIPVDFDKGIYMVAYTDNEHALTLKNNLDNKEFNRNLFARLVEISLGMKSNCLRITSLLAFFWPVCTHYYDPLPDKFRNRKEFLEAAQHPMSRMLVVGEVVSIDNGWTNGALDSVEKVLTPEWLQH
jgi:hypothetical protein